MATILAIDWGSRRIGIARANTVARLAEPLSTIDNTDTAIARIQQLAESENVDTIVVGLPRNLSGEETQQTHAVRDFVRLLEDELQCQIVMHDETLSSQVADELKQRFPNSSIDSRSATIILDDYLGSHI